MNTPANPALTSSEAGISPISSRLRAVTARAPPSWLNLPQLEVVDQVLGAGLRAQVLVEDPAPLARGQRRGRDPRHIEALVQARTGDEVVGEPAVDGDH